MCLGVFVIQKSDLNMPRFAYQALDARGAKKSGLLDAPDEKRVAAVLRAQGLFPTDVAPARGERDLPPSPRLWGIGRAGSDNDLSAAAKASTRGLKLDLRLPFVRPVRPKELAVFTRQLGTLLRAGMPLLRALEVLGRQEGSKQLVGVIGALAEAIRSGRTLSEAMEPHPGVFDRLYRNMIRAGEAGGVLEVVLERLARFQEKSLHLRGKITAALVYPFIVTAVAVLILAGLLVFVVPKFKQIFADLLKGAPLPPLTQAVLTVSEVVKNHYPTVLLAMAGLFVAGKLVRLLPGGARQMDGWTVKLPLFGDLLLKGIVARFGRTLGTLLTSGVPILPALLIARDTCANARVAGALMEVHDRVKGGAAVARPLEATGVFPPMVASMIEVGEHTGRLPEMLGKVADLYEEEVDNAVAGLSSLIEPVLVLFLAFVVGTIVIALFLPIVRIIQLLT